jgi:hypothetical protein
VVVVDNLPVASDLLADRAYDSVHIPNAIQHREALPVMPMQMSRKCALAWATPSDGCANACR